VISWAAIRLLASGAAERFLRGLSAAAQWLVSDWRNLPLVAFGGAVLWLAWVTIPARDRTIAATEALLTETQLAHLGTIASFIDASAEAQRRAEANAARVKAEQEKITDATLADLRADHVGLRARFDRLRARNAAIDPGRADPAGLPGAGSAAAGAAGAPADQDLPAGDLTPQPLCPSQFVCLTIEEAEQASIDAHNHDRLIAWVEAQSAVRFTPEEPRR
jgi:hypothetical protein